MHFQKTIPERFFDVGIAEEHAALFACGQATEGYKPFLTIYSTFMQRAYDMIIHDIALQNLPVRMCMDRAGLSGDDGPTHHGLFDIAYLSPIPNIVHMQAKDEDEFVDMLWTMTNYDKGPIAIRYPRGIGTGVKIKPKPKILKIGESEIISDGDDVAIFCLGSMIEIAGETKKLLEKENISTALINARWIKPLDHKTICSYAKKVKLICTFEDHSIVGGFGALVSNLLKDNNISTPVIKNAWPDEFIEHGTVEILRKKHGLTTENAFNKIKKRMLIKATS